MHIFGITGKARSGKDTIARWMFDNRGAYVTHFAWPIKQAICAMFGTTMEAFSDANKENPLPVIGVSPRVLAQTLGTDWGRQVVGEDVWVRSMEARLRAAGVWEPGNTIVIPDVRFENEAAWIRRNGGIVMHVSRPGADGRVGVDGHPSEAGVAYHGGDLFIHNEGSIPELHYKLSQIFAVEPA